MVYGYTPEHDISIERSVRNGSCPSVSELLSLKIGGEQSASSSMQEIQAHLLTCDSCQDRAKQLFAKFDKTMSIVKDLILANKHKKKGTSKKKSQSLPSA